MNYLWQEFNIKTFPSETVVFRDGVFMPELSTLESLEIDKKYDLPVHVIYVGEITGENRLDIDINVADQPVFLTVKIENKTPAFLTIFVKNTGKNSCLNGKVLVQNYNQLHIENHGLHVAPNTGIKINTKIVAHPGSNTRATGIAEIHPGCINCESDIGFSAMAAKDAKIEFIPKQLIAATPISAEHSASLYKASAQQVEYLREAGLGTTEVKTVLEEAFINDLLEF